MKIIIKQTVPKEFLELLVVNKHSSIITELIQLEKEPIKYNTSEFISGAATINFELSIDDINEINKSNPNYNTMLQALNSVLIPYFKISDFLKDGTHFTKRDLNPLFVHYKAIDGNYLQFIVNQYDSVKFINSMQELAVLVMAYESKSDPKLNEELAILHIQDNKKIYLENQSGSWRLIKPLNEIAHEISQEYFANRDPRSKKPHVLIDSNNLNKKMNIGHNWVLSFKSKDLFMSKPNDVSLYCSICQKNSEAANALMESMKKTMKGLIINFPSEQQQSEMFNYFEFVIQAVIFSYTSIEAFVNIIIPSHYTYTESKNGVTTTYNKNAIELQFHLRDKLKKILNDILNVTDVTAQSWWNDYIELENIRNEFIHAKESTSEERYNKLLNPKIFTQIGVNQKLLHYYGEKIMKKDPELINEYPIGYGFDITWPRLASTDGFESSRRVVMNLPEE